MLYCSFIIFILTFYPPFLLLFIQVLHYLLSCIADCTQFYPAAAGRRMVALCSTRTQHWGEKGRFEKNAAQCAASKGFQGEAVDWVVMGAHEPVKVLLLPYCINYVMAVCQFRSHPHHHYFYTATLVSSCRVSPQRCLHVRRSVSTRLAVQLPAGGESRGCPAPQKVGHCDVWMTRITHATAC